MTGTIGLQGGDEFAAGCRGMDRVLLAVAGGGPVVVTALAGAPGRETATADANGVRYFTALGAEASAAPDARTDESGAVRAIDGAALLFLPGGSPRRLLETLRRPALARALRRLLDRGGVLVGSSAGAMVLAEVTLLPERGGVPQAAAGLALVPGCVVLPHYSERDAARRQRWLQAVAGRDVVGLGLPEHSGVLVADGTWTPLGERPAWVLDGEQRRELATATPAPRKGGL